MKTKLIIGLAAAGLAGAALAQTGAADTIKARQAGMKVVGASFKGVMDQSRGTPDAAVVKKHATALVAQSGKIAGWFGPGTATAPGVKTAALPTVWSNAAGFRTAAVNYDTQAKKLLALANAGDVAAIPAQARALGGTCKGCHDDFKAKGD